LAGRVRIIDQEETKRNRHPTQAPPTANEEVTLRVERGRSDGSPNNIFKKQKKKNCFHHQKKDIDGER